MKKRIIAICTVIIILIVLLFVLVFFKNIFTNSNNKNNPSEKIDNPIKNELLIRLDQVELNPNYNFRYLDDWGYTMQGKGGVYAKGIVKDNELEKVRIQVTGDLDNVFYYEYTGITDLKDNFRLDLSCIKKEECNQICKKSESQNGYFDCINQSSFIYKIDKSFILNDLNNSENINTYTKYKDSRNFDCYNINSLYFDNSSSNHGIIFERNDTYNICFNENNEFEINLIKESSNPGGGSSTIVEINSLGLEEPEQNKTPVYSFAYLTKLIGDQTNSDICKIYNTQIPDKCNIFSKYDYYYNCSIKSNILDIKNPYDYSNKDMCYYITSVNNKSFYSCMNLNYSDNDIYECLNQLILSYKNISSCFEINNWDFNYKNEFWTKTYYGKTNSQTLYETCYKNIISNLTSKDQCLVFKNQDELEQCNLAVAKNIKIYDSSICDDLNDIDCENLAYYKQDYNICLFMSGNDRDKCLDDLSRKTFNLSICYLITDDSIRLKCINWFIENSKSRGLNGFDPEQCKNLSDERANYAPFPNSSKKDNCYFELALFTKNYTICGYINDADSKNACSSNNN